MNDYVIVDTVVGILNLWKKCSVLDPDPDPHL
jgi:hypothetical protein